MLYYTPISSLIVTGMMADVRGEEISTTPPEEIEESIETDVAEE